MFLSSEFILFSSVMRFFDTLVLLSPNNKFLFLFLHVAILLLSEFILFSISCLMRVFHALVLSPNSKFVFCFFFLVAILLFSEFILFSYLLIEILVFFFLVTILLFFQVHLIF
jgi:hypothetical protein